VIFVASLAATAGAAPNGWSAPPLLWCGGLVGAAVAVCAAKAVQAIGAALLVLAMVAGQSVGALLLDVVAPAQGQEVTVRRLASVILVLAAMALGSSARSGNRPAY
jgi:transporter family-2 protein